MIQKKLFFSTKNEQSEKELHDEKMLIKVRIARHENDSSVYKVS